MLTAEQSCIKTPYIYDKFFNISLQIDVIIIIIIIIIINPRKNEGGKNKKNTKKLVWSGKTSPGGPQRENRCAAIRR